MEITQAFIGVWVQAPVPASQLSAVHSRVSSQSLSEPASHAPERQLSWSVHRFPSEQGRPSAKGL